MTKTSLASNQPTNAIQLPFLFGDGDLNETKNNKFPTNSVSFYMVALKRAVFVRD